MEFVLKINISVTMQKKPLLTEAGTFDLMEPTGSPRLGLLCFHISALLFFKLRMPSILSWTTDTFCSATVCSRASAQSSGDRGLSSLLLSAVISCSCSHVSVCFGCLFLAETLLTVVAASRPHTHYALPNTLNEQRYQEFPRQRHGS